MSAMKSSEISFGQAASHSPCIVQEPNHRSISSTMLITRSQPERWERVINMVDEMERWFGSCTMHGECEAACPKEISLDFIALMNRDYVKAQFKQRRLTGQRS